MSWIDEFGSVFFVSVGTLLVGAFGVAVKYCLKSKCEHLSLCFGLIKIDRRVDLEVAEEMKAMELGRHESKEDITELKEEHSPKTTGIPRSLNFGKK